MNPINVLPRDWICFYLAGKLTIQEVRYTRPMHCVGMWAEEKVCCTDVGEVRESLVCEVRR